MQMRVCSDNGQRMRIRVKTCLDDRQWHWLLRGFPGAGDGDGGGDGDGYCDGHVGWGGYVGDVWDSIGGGDGGGSGGDWGSDDGTSGYVGDYWRFSGDDDSGSGIPRDISYGDWYVVVLYWPTIHDTTCLFGSFTASNTGRVRDDFGVDGFW